jgi:hypothetical protein
MGGETAIYMDLSGDDGRARRAAGMRRLLEEGDARRAAGLAGPEPTETAQEKVKRLATEFHARAHFRENAPKLRDVAGDGRTLTELAEADDGR